MKKTTALVFASAVFAASAAVPVIDSSSVSVKQGGGKTVVIEYTMNPATEGDTEPAIVTVDILTNAVGETAASVGGEHLWTLTGDVNRVVCHTADFKHKILWYPHREGMGEWTLPAAQVTARVTLWSTNAPPAYWVVDIDGINDRSNDRYYPDAAQVPGTVTNDTYKIDKFVFRHVPASGVTWRQGASKDDCSSATDKETRRYVTFSYDWYMGIYPVTRAQHAKMVGNGFSSYTGFGSTGPTEADFTSILPLTGTPVKFQFNGIDNAKDGFPTNGRFRVLTQDYYLKRFRNYAKIAVDLPTQAEYEYTCRAGSTNLWVCGDGDIGDYAWYSGNAEEMIHGVGLKLPNDWGFYDIQGNVWEFCLDRHDSNARTSDPVWDPLGPYYLSDGGGTTTSSYRRMYGGNYTSDKTAMRASSYGTVAPATNTSEHGFRLVVLMP